ncbi:hypothetical protein AB1Y20_015944 [Prymnesium parvum]|uniref:18S rRNA factor 2 n=1 Tax=Prymnesium parvum TaxID=97485 RepID=A0AB34JZZ0_PRYPA|mmetsp:Transcript_49459/g.122949  ORF Transcript_49459/g.122949 Transcript_49459/m.122949 type:complete len:278 (-) Transcript_49459:299-1132(-)
MAGGTADTSQDGHANIGPERVADETRRPVIRKKTLSKKKVREFQEEQENRGVVYISRIPPYLKPSKLRNLLEGYGTEVLRVYLSPEDTAARARRVRAGGNKKKSFTDGWVEFANKRRAKRIASTLNNTPMDPQNHRSFYGSDLWNIRYLPKFKWHHLTEKVAADARARQEKMRAELSQAKKETNFYLKKVEQAKAIEAMEERKRKRSQLGADGDGADEQEAGGPKKRRAEAEGAGVQQQDGGIREVRRRFKQRKVARGRTAKSVEDVIGMLAPKGTD